MTELDKLEMYLKEHGIKYERIDEDNLGRSIRHQIAVPCMLENGKTEWDAICQKGSYGFESGLLEIYGSLVNKEIDGDSVVGWLTAEDVILRLECSQEINS